jgi:hypothetical protein
MEGTSNLEHDRWMTKITQALRSFRTASLRKAEQAETPRHPTETEGGTTDRDRT